MGNKERLNFFALDAAGVTQTPIAAPCGHFATLVRSTFGLRGFPPIHFVHLRRIYPHIRRTS